MRAVNRVFLLLSVCIGLTVSACQRAANQSPVSAPIASVAKRVLSEEEIRAKRQKLEKDLLALKADIIRMREQWIELQKRTISPDLRYAIYRYPFPEEIEATRIQNELAGTREDLARIESQQKLAELRPGLSSSFHLHGLEKEIEEKEQQRKRMQSELDQLNQEQVN